MKKRTQKIISIFLLVLGVFLLIIQPLNPITGAIIDLSTNVSVINFIIGLLMIIIGIILYSTATVEERVGTIIRTKRFDKAIRRTDPKIISRAIEKIGTGLADEKHFHGYAGGGYQIRTDKGGRIHYQIDNNRRVILTDYKPSSEHR